MKRGLGNYYFLKKNVKIAMMGNQNPPMEKKRIISGFFSEGRDLSNASSKEGIKKI